MLFVCGYFKGSNCKAYKCYLCVVISRGLTVRLTNAIRVLLFQGV